MKALRKKAAEKLEGQEPAVSNAGPYRRPDWS
jgi:hypothetical protein